MLPKPESYFPQSAGHRKHSMRSRMQAEVKNVAGVIIIFICSIFSWSEFFGTHLCLSDLLESDILYSTSIW